MKSETISIPRKSQWAKLSLQSEKQYRMHLASRKFVPNTVILRPETQLCQKTLQSCVLLYFWFRVMIFTWNQALSISFCSWAQEGLTQVILRAGRIVLCSSQTSQSKALGVSEQIQQLGASGGRIIPGTSACADCLGATSWLQMEIVGELWSTSYSWLFSQQPLILSHTNLGAFTAGSAGPCGCT